MVKLSSLSNLISPPKHSWDDVFQTTYTGSFQKALTNNLFGFNHTMVPTATQTNKEMHGLTFFVRPQLNLQSDNIFNVRQFYNLLKGELGDPSGLLSLQAWLRQTLDPRLALGYNSGVEMPGMGQSPLVDPKQAFIPILTNNLLSLSGWPDVNVGTFTSRPALKNSEFSMVDGYYEIYNAFDIDTTFQNVVGNPIVGLMDTWIYYSCLVFEGRCVPYPDFIVENAIDYNTRIYRITLSKDKKQVAQIAASGISFPFTVPKSNFFDFNRDIPYNDSNKEFSIRFKCNGAIYNDPILIYEFNKTVIQFNADMADGKRGLLMTEITTDLLNDDIAKKLLNNRGYPRINPDNMNLEWWIGKEIYKARLSMYNSSLLSTLTSILP